MIHPASRGTIASRGGTLAVLLALNGCVAYQPAPVDRDAHQAAFLARLPAGSIGAASASIPPVGDSDDAPVNLDDGLSAREGELVALLFQAELRIARARLGVAEANAATAGLWDDPVLAADVKRVLESIANPWKAQAVIGITLPISGRLEAERARAGAHRDAELLRVFAREWQARVDVRRAWVRWSSLQERVAILRELIARTAEVASIADRLEQAGEISRIEARLFRIEQAGRTAELRALETEVEEAELALRRQLGLGPDAAIRFEPSLRAPSIDGDRDSRRARWAANDPTMRSAEAEYEVAERALAVEIRRQYPDLEIGPGYGEDEGDPEAILTVALPIPLWNRNQAGVARAQAERTLARVTLETTLEARLVDLAAAEERWAGAEAERVLLESELVPLAETEYMEAVRIAELGEMNSVVLLDAIVRRIEARNRLIEAQAREALAAFDLLELLGPLPAVTVSSIEGGT